MSLLPIRTRGRAGIEPIAVVDRPLTAADLATLGLARESRPPAIKRLRDSHHAVARMLAEGKRPAEIHLVTGYSGSRISILQSDPAFQELVTFYKKERNTAFADLHDRMAALSMDITEELQDRLNDDPEQFSTNQLRELFETLADRTGHGPQTKSQNVNINANLGDRMRAARERTGASAPASQSLREPVLAIEAPASITIEAEAGPVPAKAEDSAE